MPELPLTYARLSAKDPTKTTTLRAQLSSDFARRFKKIRRAILQAVAVDDVFGLRQGAGEVFVTHADPEPGAWVYRTDAEKVEQFKLWINELVGANILELTMNPVTNRMGLWVDRYLAAVYGRGIITAQSELEKSGVLAKTTPFIGKVGPTRVNAVMGMQVHRSTLELIFTRAFTDLEGITANMSAQLSRVLAAGLSEGLTPLQLARELVARVDGFPGIKPRPSSGYYGMSAVNRAKLLARTEIVRAYNTAKITMFKQMADITGEPIKVRWITAADERVRDEHRPWHNQIYSFETALGMLGAPNCLLGTAMCHSPSRVERVFQRFYNGPIVILACASGNQLACTPNHPIATERGFVPAALLNKGDRVLNCRFSDDAVSTGMDKKNVVTAIEDIFSSFSLSRHVTATTKTSALDFHGDGAGSEIAVIRSDSELLSDVDASKSDFFGNDPLHFCGMQNILGSHNGAFLLDMLKVFLASPRQMGGINLFLSLFRRHFLPFYEFGFASPTDRNAVFSKPSDDDLSAAPEGFRERFNGLPGVITLEKINKVEFESFSGHVYNLQTEKGFYLATGEISKTRGDVNTYITGNCRCTIVPYVLEE